MNPSALRPLAPFAVQSFRFQWPADLLMSWAFEMETLILGWYVFVETDSVFFLALFGSLQFIGTLLAPFTGVAGDRLGRRTTLCTMRAILTLLAGVIMALGLLDLLRPAYVLPIAFLTGLVRPSDLVMRNSLIGDTMTPATLMSALGLSRMTMDSARIAGALVGAGLFAALGIGIAYVFVATFYALSFACTLGVSRTHPNGEPDGQAADAAALSLWAARWRDLKDGLVYTRRTPAVLGVMWLAFLLNFSAFPLSHQLLPYVAREIYGIDATGLSHLVAGFASGALIGSIIMTVMGGERRSPRFMMVNVMLWYAIIGMFAQLETKASGLAVLFVMGIVHNLAMVSLSGVLLRVVAERFRARVMGIRMLCVYGLPLGLMLTSPLIERFGYPATATLYVTAGLLFTVIIGYRWRRTLWQ